MTPAIIGWGLATYCVAVLAIIGWFWCASPRRDSERGQLRSTDTPAAFTMIDGTPYTGSLFVEADTHSRRQPLEQGRGKRADGGGGEVHEVNNDR